jgi:hypothetical protein
MDVEKSKTSGAPDSWHFSPNGSNTESQQTNPASTQGTSATEPQDGGQQQAPSADDVTWSASEFVAHDKSINWYIALAASVLFFTAIVYLITKDKITSGVIIFAAIIFGVYAARKPRTLDYHLGMSGLTIGPKFYDFSQFRSFVVLHDGALSSVSFMPLKRFMPILTVYYEQQDEQRIVGLLSSRLPMENRGRDVIDRFLHRIRF